MGVFQCDNEGSVLSTYDGITRHGHNARSVLRLCTYPRICGVVQRRRCRSLSKIVVAARAYDRGTPLMPLGILVDLYMGYQAGIGPATNHWNVLPMSGNDTALDYLFKQQLFVDSGLPDAELKTTPHGLQSNVVCRRLQSVCRPESETGVCQLSSGEIADVILSDADADFLSLYPVILLVGEQDFSAASGLSARLIAALKTNGVEELLMQQYHRDMMPPTAWAELNATRKVRIVTPAAIGKQVC